MPHRLAVLVVVGLLAASATAQQRAGPAPQGGSASDQAFVAVLRDLMADVHRNLPTGDVDQDFVRLILSQHQAAIAMAKAELRFGKDERLKVLAKEIVTSQEKEIALIKAWEDRKRGGH